MMEMMIARIRVMNSIAKTWMLQRNAKTDSSHAITEFAVQKAISVMDVMTVKMPNQENCRLMKRTVQSVRQTLPISAIRTQNTHVQRRLHFVVFHIVICA